MTSTVEFQSRLQPNLTLDISARDQLVQTLFGRVEAIDVGLVVFGVMEVHDVFGYRRLEGLRA